LGPDICLDDFDGKQAGKQTREKTEAKDSKR